MREQVNQYAETIEQLGEQSQEVVPLKTRSQRQMRPRKITALCAYKQLNVSESQQPHMTVSLRKINYFSTVKLLRAKIHSCLMMTCTISLGQIYFFGV